MSRDYIPKSDPRFMEWVQNMYDEAVNGYVKWKVAAPELFLETPMSVFEAKLAKMSDPNHGKIDTLEKNTARKTLEKACREYVQGFLAKNPLVTDVDRERMGLNVHDTVPTSVADPAGQAEAQISYPGRTQLRLRIKHVEGTPLDAKADYGYRVYYGIYAADGAMPASGVDLHESRFTRRKGITFSFMPADSGKTAFFAIRYENSKGKTGPWGPMFSAVIP